MSQPVIKVENRSKLYRPGTIGPGTIRSDLQRWWCNLVGKEDPTLLIGRENNLAPLNPPDRWKNNRGKNSPSKGGGRREADYVWALRDINFEVKQGETLGLLLFTQLQ